MEFEKVRDIIVETLGCDAEQVTPTASLADDLGADSLASVELVMALEEAAATAPRIDDRNAADVHPLFALHFPAVVLHPPVGAVLRAAAPPRQQGARAPRL